MKNTGGRELVAQLEGYGIDTVFGMPGVHTLAFFDPLAKSTIRHIGARHEQGAGFMADGYARATGKPGVCLIISGPGVTNAATPIGQAYSDSIPVLAVTSAIARDDMGLGRGMLHEITNQQAVTAPITGFSATALTGRQISEHLARAMTSFRTERPRPVHISIPLDILDEDVAPRPVRTFLPRQPGPNPEDVKAAADLLRAAKRPIVLAGGGCRNAGAALTRLVESLQAPIVTTVAGKGVVAESHPLSLGSTLQRARIRRLVELEADLVIAIGTEISEPDLYVTADSEAASDGPARTDTTRLAISGRFVRIDIDPAATVRDYTPDAAIVSDAGLAAAALADEMSRQPLSSTWDLDFETIRQQVRQEISPLERQHVAVLDAIRNALPPDALVYADMTQIAYTGCVYFPVDVPGTWHFPVGYGTLGYALPASIGGAAGSPGRACLALVGDGGLLFTVQELATAVEQKLPLPIVLWDNDGLGEIADFMRARNIPEVSVRPLNPDFVALADAFGCRTATPRSLEEIEDAIRGALSADRPTVILVRQDAEYLR
ncbi:5-guanidino-2-oxopentanoate decarboxylase [Shinella sp. 838]|jgi:5-guanidino-2-oxopentanoate decarboxylase|uniref:5-guanidino-2-oxopentanoate decarboxylase n=1 Tax=unclassified Shinella TaxID=2643062 RepID=UPI0003C55E36|nr:MULTISPECIES: 5-guanidino-2-oxopentanoate decarboxylase [unclassified Shinella]EYR81937.1 putative 2-ketoarginine decarboxylase AruI [Shinella sp. DD12]MCA0338195.1 5-guanidino-2-oxopentanoate decarboxylase [Pseudomonadota bacterium]MDG4670544.1 5-guanidino-2-oxopentanoate decarboxylase [Shinella sp. 838]